MTPKARLLSVASLLVSLGAAPAGCFNPEAQSAPIAGREPATQGDQPDEACVVQDDPCMINGDCCGFSEDPRVGDDLCVDDAYGSACTPTCLSGEECNTGCCAQLEGIDGYGFCGRPEACEQGWGFEPADASCLRGVGVLCECAEATDSPCDAQMRADFAASCGDEGSEVYDAFRCIDAMSSQGCVDSLDACVPSETALAPGPVLTLEPGRSTGSAVRFGFATGVR